MAFSQQRAHRNAQKLSEKIQQRRLDRRNGMDCNAQVEGLSTIALVSGDLPGLDHRFPTNNLVGKKFGELLSIVGDHIETDRLELCLDVGRSGRSCEFSFEPRPDRSGRNCGRRAQSDRRGASGSRCERLGGSGSEP